MLTKMISNADRTTPRMRENLAPEAKSASDEGATFKNKDLAEAITRATVNLQRGSCDGRNQSCFQ